MDRQQVGQERMRSWFVNVTVVVVFFVLMLTALRYFYRNEPDIKLLNMQMLASQFVKSVNNAHWQWQSEGRPQMIVLVHYNQEGQETDRRPINMSHLGWPRFTPNKDGCAQLWKMILNVPMDIEGFQVIPDYYDGVKLTGSALSSTCRFRLSTGPYFDYLVYTGQVVRSDKLQEQKQEE